MCIVSLRCTQIFFLNSVWSYNRTDHELIQDQSTIQSRSKSHAIYWGYILFAVASGEKRSSEEVSVAESCLFKPRKLFVYVFFKPSKSPKLIPLIWFKGAKRINYAECLVAKRRMTHFHRGFSWSQMSKKQYAMLWKISVSIGIMGDWLKWLQPGWSLIDLYFSWSTKNIRNSLLITSHLLLFNFFIFSLLNSR